MSILKYICDLGFAWLTKGTILNDLYLLAYTGPYSRYLLTTESVLDESIHSLHQRKEFTDTIRGDLERLQAVYTVKISRRFSEEWAAYIEADVDQTSSPTIVFTTSTMQALERVKTEAELDHILLHLFGTFFHELSHLILRFVSLEIFGALDI